MPIYNGIRYYDLRENFAEGIGEQGPHGRRAFLVDWSDRYAFANTLLGISTLAGGVNGSVSFTDPTTYPESPNLYARTVDIRGVGAISQGTRQIAWEKAIIICNYGVAPYNMGGGGGGGAGGDNLHDLDPESPLLYASQSLHFGTQSIPIRPGKLQYMDGAFATRYMETYSLDVGLVTMNITLHKLPFLIPKSVRDCVRQMNNAPFLGCATGTLLLADLDTQRSYFDNSGTPVQETRIQLLYRPTAKWSMVPNPKGTDATWYELSWLDGTPVVKSFDMRKLIPNGYRSS